MNKALEFNNLAIEYSQKDDYKNALKYFKKALEQEPENSQILFNYGTEFLKREKLQEAKELLEKSEKDLCQDEKFLENMTTLFFKMEDLEKADFYCSKGILADEGNPVFWNLKGVIDFNRNDFDSAEKHFTKALKLCKNKNDPVYNEALLNLKDTLSETGHQLKLEDK